MEAQKKFYEDPSKKPKKHMMPTNGKEKRTQINNNHSLKK